MIHEIDRLTRLGFHSPFYTESHIKFRKAVREFFDTHVKEEALAFDDSGKPASDEVFLKMGAAGILAARIGPGILCLK